MTPAAVLLDVDGTLVDTNYLHVTAWWEAFLDHGHVVACADVHRALGRGSEDLVKTLIGRAEPSVVDGHAQRWAELRKRMQPFPGAAALIRACADRGLRVVWATSGSEEDLEDVKRVLQVDDVVHAIVSSADVRRSKPHPDIVQAALEAAGVTAQRAIMVGDTVYDIRAAAAAGVSCIALTAGGIGSDELRAEGPAAVYRDCVTLLDDLEASPIGALTSPG